jgi:hypothetical protein
MTGRDCHPVMNLYGISLLLFLRRKDPDAGSESGMTGRDCHPVVPLNGIPLLLFLKRKDRDPGKEREDDEGTEKWSLLYFLLTTQCLTLSMLV